MDNLLEILQRADSRALGRFLMEGRASTDREIGEELTEEQVRLFLEDELRLALRHGGENMETRIREVVDGSWERGKMAGFMAGIRAGARAVLALLGDGEVRI